MKVELIQEFNEFLINEEFEASYMNRDASEIFWSDFAEYDNDAAIQDIDNFLSVFNTMISNGYKGSLDKRTTEFLIKWCETDLNEVDRHDYIFRWTEDLLQNKRFHKTSTTQMEFINAVAAMGVYRGPRSEFDVNGMTINVKRLTININRDNKYDGYPEIYVMLPKGSKIKGTVKVSNAYLDKMFNMGLYPSISIEHLEVESKFPDVVAKMFKKCKIEKSIRLSIVYQLSGVSSVKRLCKDTEILSYYGNDLKGMTSDLTSILTARRLESVNGFVKVKKALNILVDKYNLSKVEDSIKSAGYNSVEDFESDTNILINTYK